MASHSSTLAWKIPWTEEPGRLWSMGSLRVGHDWATSLSCIGEGNSNPLQCSCLENPRDGGAWWAAVYGVAQSQTWLKWLSSSSSKTCRILVPRSGIKPCPVKWKHGALTTGLPGKSSQVAIVLSVKVSTEIFFFLLFFFFLFIDHATHLMRS